ncbi:MAG: ostA-like family protein [Alkalinema sp. RL_2_19]|nr:ostA-like family protein [Alkalinema sp. RL_2_19]
MNVKSFRRGLMPLLLAGGLWSTTIAPLPPTPVAIAQSGNPRALQLRANATQANAKTGVVVASGNVQIDYPARDIKATAAQATYYSREGRMVLSGNVYILQEGNSLRGEEITYMLNEGRFVAKPQPGKQVEAIYLLPPEAEPVPAPVAPAPAPVAPKKQPFPTPVAPD